jgi:hypothetical protein
MNGEKRTSATDYGVLGEIIDANQTWPVLSAKYGVENPVPPWKTSLDGLCDVLDKSCAAVEELGFTFQQRRAEEDELTATRYANLPYPESQLVSLAHSLLARGVITEDDLRARLQIIRARLEAK